MGMKKLIQRILSGEIEKSLLTKIVIGTFLGTACIGGIAYFALHSNNETKIEQSELNIEKKYEEYSLLYEDSVFMNTNDIMSEDKRTENTSFLENVKEKIDNKSIDEESENELNTLNNDLTELSENNKKSMLDEFHKLMQSYNVAIVDDAGNTTPETLYDLKDDEKTEGLTVIDVKVPDKEINEVKDLVSKVSEDIKNKYYKDCNEDLILLASKLSGYSGSDNEVVNQIVEQYKNTTNADSNSKSILTPEMLKTFENKKGSNAASNNVQTPEDENNSNDPIHRTITTQPSGSAPNNNNNDTTKKENEPANNQNTPKEPQPNPQPQPEPKPEKTPEKEQPKKKYTWDDSCKVNEILNKWFDCEITEQEAESELRSAFPSYNMKLMHYGKGEENAANKFWNSIDGSYLKSNILVSSNYGSYFIYGK